MGHVVSGDGIETDPEKIEKIRNWPTPSNADELRSNLAFAGYYRPCKWTENEQHIFEQLKEKLSNHIFWLILTLKNLLNYTQTHQQEHKGQFYTKHKKVERA